MNVLSVKYAIWAADFRRCLAFYRDAFGAEVQFEMEVWSEFTLGGATIGVHGGGEGKRTWTGLTIRVDDIFEGIERVTSHGGGLVREPEEEDGQVHLAMCYDPEGNEFMLTCPRA